MEEKKIPYRRWSRVFTVLSLVLSHVMVGVVAYSYSDMVCGGLHKCYSAPPEVAFLGGIPYVIGISICAGLAWWFHRRDQSGRAKTDS